MKLTRNALALGFAVAAVSAAAACSSQHGSTVGSGGTGANIGVNGEGHGNAGTVGMHLNIPGGFTIDSLDWTISNGTNTYTGKINMTDDAGHAAQSIEFVAGPVVAGPGYTVTLSGHDSNGDPCQGTSPTFAVTAGTSTTATAAVNVTCTVAADAALSSTVDSGSVAVDAGITLVNQAPFQCPGITGVSISPAELNPPQLANLGAGVTNNASGGTPTLMWSATCNGPAGTAPIITNPTSPNATFSCGTVVPPTGSVYTCQLTLTVGLNGTGADGGSVGQVCTGLPNTAISETIVCEPGGSTLPTCGAGQTQCGSSTSDCENLSNGSGPNHLCGTACGTAVVCGGTTPVCQGGVCVSQPPTACTTSPCNATGPNSVQCNGNANGGVCTAEEALFVAKDIAAGLLVSGQLKTTGGNAAESCYECLLANQCLNDAAGDNGQECGDVAANAPTLNNENGPQACLDVINCTIANACATSNPDLPGCYCGSTATGTCVTTGPALGPCVNVETNGLNTTTPGTVNTSYTSVGLPAGVANVVFACAFSNGCAKCLN